MANSCGKTKVYNHLYPRFHIKKWVQNGGRLYDKETEAHTSVNEARLFTEEKYYSLGENNSELEDRLADFEQYIGSIIKKIDESEDEVTLSGKQLEILKLYCVLCANRHEHTTEVIQNDGMGIYQSNNYLVGVHRPDNQRDAVKVTEMIVTEFEKLKAMPDDIASDLNYLHREKDAVSTPFTFGLHIAIARAEKNILCVSDKFCIIENTLDSDFLYAYVPVSPKTALFLVKSKYYFGYEEFEYTKQRFGKKYGCGKPDPYLSVILGAYKNFDVEDCLFCSYGIVRSHVHRDEVYVKARYVRQPRIDIDVLPEFIFQHYNSIFCEDGSKILYCDREAFDNAMRIKLNCREVTYR